MKKMLFIMLMLAVVSIASDKCLFDAYGTCALKIQSNQEIGKIKNTHKKYYIAEKREVERKKNDLYLTPQVRKSKSKKRWYEVDWNQGVKLCPEKNFNTGDGTWIVNGSAHIDSKNCVYVDGSPYTRSILVLFSRNLNDLTDADSSWILVNQVIVELAGKKFSVRGDNRVEYQRWGANKNKEEIEKKEVVLSQDLIVDRTELRARDAYWLMEGKTHKELYFKHGWKAFYHTTDSLEIMDYPINPKTYALLFPEWRSEKDGLDYVFKKIPIDEVDTAHVRFRETQIRHVVDVFDSTANGYRMPMLDEWKVLQLGGKASSFLWGDEEDENELKKYMNINCASTQLGVYPVKQYAPNAFGLYDVYGNAEEYSLYFPYKSNNRISEATAMECFQYNSSGFSIGQSCNFLKKYVCRAARSSRPQWLYGMRLVRKLE